MDWLAEIKERYKAKPAPPPIEFKALAATAWTVFARVTGIEEPPAMDSLPEEIQCAWEAVARHLAGLLVTDPEDGPPDFAANEQAYKAGWKPPRLRT